MAKFSVKCDTRPNAGSIARAYDTTSIIYDVQVKLPNGKPFHFTHRDPRQSVESYCKEQGFDYETAIVKWRR